MTMQEIINKHYELERKLKIALSTMEKKDVINSIHLEFIDLQQKCPHFSAEHNFEIIDGECPYCGKKIFGG